MNLSKNINYLKRILSNKGKTPLYLIFFVTSKCNLKCSHCFYWKSLNKIRNELTLGEILKIAKRLEPLMLLRLTGGEPTLRSDLADIIKIFYKYNGVRNIGISTNGFLTKKLIDVVKDVLRECKDIYFEVCVSLDDFELHHDKNRGVLGAYKKAVDSIRNLKEIKKEYKNLVLVTTITVTNKNHNRLNKIFENVILPLNPDFAYVNLVRGLPRVPEIKEVNLEKYIEFVNKVRVYNNKKTHKLYINANIKDKLISELTVNSVRQKKFQNVYCLAGNKVGVMYSNGDIFPCELLNQKIGNVRDYNYDFRKLCNSPKAEQVRKYIKETKCFCTHECFLTVNLLLSPKNMIRFLKEILFKGA